MGNKIEGVKKLQHVASDEEKQDVINQRTFVTKRKITH